MAKESDKGFSKEDIQIDIKPMERHSKYFITKGIQNKREMN